MDLVLLLLVIIVDDANFSPYIRIVDEEGASGVKLGVVSGHRDDLFWRVGIIPAVVVLEVFIGI